LVAVAAPWGVAVGAGTGTSAARDEFCAGTAAGCFDASAGAARFAASAVAASDDVAGCGTLDESARWATLAAGGGRETLGACAKSMTTTKVQAAPAAKAATTLGQERLGAAGAAKIRESCGEPWNSEVIGMPPGGLSVSPPFVGSRTNFNAAKGGAVPPCERRPRRGPCMFRSD